MTLGPSPLIHRYRPRYHLTIHAKLASISLRERPASQWIKILVASVTPNVLLIKLTPQPADQYRGRLPFTRTHLVIRHAEESRQHRQSVRVILDRKVQQSIGGVHVGVPWLAIYGASHCGLEKLTTGRIQHRRSPVCMLHLKLILSFLSTTQNPDRRNPPFLSLQPVNHPRLTLPASPQKRYTQNIIQDVLTEWWDVLQRRSRK